MKEKLPILIFLCLLAGVLLFVNKIQKPKEEEKKRLERLKTEYPELVNRLLLFLQAGLVLRSAFYRMASDYKAEYAKTNKRIEAFEEIVKLCAEMDKGIGESECYRAFGSRCRLPAYRSLSVLLNQSLRKGSSSLMNMLEKEVVRANEDRIRLARVKGERAGVKLLIPMGMMLIIVLAIVIIPAFTWM